MSQLRKVKVRFDLEKAKEVALKKGYAIRESDFIRSYATRDIRAPLVIVAGGREFGIMESGELIYDDMYADTIQDFIASYVEEGLSERGYSCRRITAGNKIVLTVGV